MLYVLIGYENPNHTFRAQHTLKVSWEEALIMLTALDKQEERLKEDDLNEKVMIEKLKNKIYNILPHI